MEAFSTGTLPGAGSFHCESCGYAIALHERDQVPSCPHCRGGRFSRSSMFAAGGTADANAVAPAAERPDWLAEAREALTTSGDYLAYDDGERVRVLPLQEGWTRIGRSLAAHVRFEDPTVSRRHALLHREGRSVRILDDRSLNGVWVNGEHVDWHELEDGDEITVGRFRLYMLRVARTAGLEAAAG